MPEQLRAVAAAQSSPIPETRAERRQMRRAGICLQVRIRPADLKDGNFDEVRLTQNASRKAIYFFTELNRYYKGMRVRATFPYKPDAVAGNLEQMGVVARIHRRDDGYGVAISFLSHGQTAGLQSPGGDSPAGSEGSPNVFVARTEESERRCGARSPFIAPVEMVELGTGTRLQARTSDLSVRGCYVDTLNPLPVGAAVRLQIQRSNMILDVLANVSSRHVGSGMGLVFEEMADAQRAVLKGWLFELGLPPTGFENPLPKKSPALAPDADRVVRLVQMLLRKGVLNQSEAREILHESEN